MLRTNSKKAIEGIKNYIMAHYERPEDLGYEGYVLPEKPEFCDIAKYIYSIFK